ADGRAVLSDEVSLTGELGIYGGLRRGQIRNAANGIKGANEGALTVGDIDRIQIPGFGGAHSIEVETVRVHHQAGPEGGGIERQGRVAVQFREVIAGQTGGAGDIEPAVLVHREVSDGAKGSLV